MIDSRQYWAFPDHEKTATADIAKMQADGVDPQPPSGVSGPASRPAPSRRLILATVLTPSANPFRGVVVWLTKDQGGRAAGPPRPPYATTAYVPPATVQTGGLASFVLDGFEPAAWRSAAEGRWLAVDNEWPHHVEPGSVVVITEGPKPVGYLHVDQVVTE